MATIPVAELARLVVANTEALGGAQGLSGPVVPRSVWDMSFLSAVPYFYLFLFLFVLVVTLAITWRMQRNRMGYYLRAVRGSERAARSLGAAAPRYKLLAFLLSAALTAVAGGLYATLFGFVDPESVLGLLVSVKMLTMAALGGAGTGRGSPCCSRNSRWSWRWTTPITPPCCRSAAPCSPGRRPSWRATRKCGASTWGWDDGAGMTDPWRTETGGWRIDVLVQGYPGKTVCHGGLGWSTIALLRGHGRVALVDVGSFAQRLTLQDGLRVCALPPRT